MPLPAPEPKLWSGVLRASLAALAELGIDTDRILAEIDVDRSVLDDPDARVPFETTSRIWPVAQLQWQKPGLGLQAGRNLRFGELGVLDYLLATAPTLGEGLLRMSEAFVVVSRGATSVQWQREPGGPGFLVFGGLLPPEVRDFGISGNCYRIRQRGGTPRVVTFAGPPLAAASVYREQLGVVPTFEAERNAIEIAATDLDRPIESSDYRGLGPILGRELRRLLSRLGETELATQVQRTIAQALPQGPPSIAVVARTVGMAERTLQRRLSEEGLTLRGLVEQTRHTLARRHLESDRLRVAEIAYMLGYAEPGAFAHAFKRWEGVSPTEYRKKP